MNQEPRVAVTGLGVLCAGGADEDAFFRLLCSGTTALRSEPARSPPGLGPIALVPQGGDESELGERASWLALQAALQALGPTGPPPLPPERLGVVVGTTSGGKALWLEALACGGPARGDWTYGAPARAVAQRVGAGVVEVVSVACASGNAALGTALDLIREGTCDAVLAGGVDVLTDFVLSGFAALRAHARGPCRPFDRDRDGLSLGEGAAFLLLEAAPLARARGRRVRAWLDGYGVACDATHMTGPDREGGGAARAMAAALAEAGASPEEVDFVSLHGTGTRYNDLMEARGLASALGPRAATVPVNSIKGAIGHTLGAAAALEAVMAVRALEAQLVPPTAGLQVQDPEIPLRVVHEVPLRTRLETVLSTASGFGGLNAAVLLRRGDR
ncbi:MAG: beta-ketoacyl synthase N-terminal-like domain-containing protein [Myxococcales bacterium]|nr:hypothetical protein [Myxococcota bacterium]MDW8281182.1 beta-ketoacyl synthase N-terminal-like domain-containing protein [Myxococcales bacterium]